MYISTVIFIEWKQVTVNLIGRVKWAYWLKGKPLRMLSFLENGRGG